MFLHPLQSKIIMYQGNKKMAQSPFLKLSKSTIADSRIILRMGGGE